jgi:carbonic anhydrase
LNTVISLFLPPYRAIPTLVFFSVVVVGHTQCGGAAACFAAAQATPQALAVPSTASDAPINRWLAPLTSLASSLNYKPSTPAAAALRMLVEDNVKVQVENICKSGTVTSAWNVERKPLWVHGWVYEIENGTLKDLGISKGPSEKL